jgi:hypothetical protein
MAQMDGEGKAQHEPSLFINSACLSTETGQYALTVVITLECPIFCKNALNASRVG